MAVNKSITKARLTAWKSDPCAFAKEVFAVQLYDKQEELLRLVANNQYVSCKSGQKTSKSFSLAILSLWKAVCFDNVKVFLVAPTLESINDMVFLEIKKLYKKAIDNKIPLGGNCGESCKTGVKFNNGNTILGRTTNQVENIQGRSGGSGLFYILDECSGIKPEFIDPILGNLSGGGSIVCVSNPTRIGDFFHSTFTSNKHYWKNITLSQLDSPNYKQRQIVIDGLATYEQVERNLATFTEVLKDVRVFGNFPTSSNFSIINESELSIASTRPKLHTDLDKGFLFVDVARFGEDSSCLIPCRGNRVFEPIEVKKQDLVFLSGLIYQTTKGMRQYPEEKITVVIDTCGIGAGVYDILKQKEDIKVIGVNVGEASNKPDEFPRLRDEAYFNCAEWIKSSCQLPDNDRLKQELMAHEYSFDDSQRRKVTKKDDVKKKLNNSSPDFSDALAIGSLYAYKKESQNSKGKLSELNQLASSPYRFGRN